MKVSGFTIVRNAVKYNYPVIEAIKSILPICDEMIIVVGESEDSTLELMESIKDPKIKIFKNKWNFEENRSQELANQTNIALSKCTGDWAFYIQSDEAVHEKDLPVLKKMMEKYLDDDSIDAIRSRYFHLYGSFYRYRIDAGWYQKEDRIIRNNGTIHSVDDAKGFERIDGRQMKRVLSPCYIYHYGWVQDESLMKERRVNAEGIWWGIDADFTEAEKFKFQDITEFPIYFGHHPKVMKNRVNGHNISVQDLKRIKKQFFWSPLVWFRPRYKTFLRNKKQIQK